MRNAATAENIEQRYVQVAGPRKMEALTRILEVEPFEAMIVFVRTKQATDENIADIPVAVAKQASAPSRAARRSSNIATVGFENLL